MTAMNTVNTPTIHWRGALSLLLRLIRFLPLYLREMTLSNVRVALDVLRPKPDFHPGFVTISLAGYDPLECWAAASLISMTPGTLSLDLADGSDQLVVHSLYLHDPAQAKAELETLVRRALGTPRNSKNQ